MQQIGKAKDLKLKFESVFYIQISIWVNIMKFWDENKQKIYQKILNIPNFFEFQKKQTRTHIGVSWKFEKWPFFDAYSDNSSCARTEVHACQK